MRRILISGIPATGKTTLGNYLEENFGFRHFDVESPEASPSTKLGYSFWSSNIREFISQLGESKNIVITWGFTPDHQLSLQILRELQKHDFKFVWLTAPPEAAKSEFINRKNKTGRGSVEEFDSQIEKLERFDLSDIGNVITIEAFNKHGRKPLDHICSELP